MLSTAVWRTHDLSAIGIFLVTSTDATVTTSFSLTLADYGFTGLRFEVDLVTSNGTRTKVASVADGKPLTLKRSVPGRSVQMLEVRPASV